MSSAERRTIRYSGQVQGVGFRWTVQMLFEGRPLSGRVRNLRDGKVELVLEGEPQDLDRAESAVLDRLGGHIRHAERTVGAATGEFRGFRISR